MAATDLITRAEHEEFSTRMEAENQKLQLSIEGHREESNRRLAALEALAKNISEMNVSQAQTLTEIKYIRKDQQDSRDDVREIRSKLESINTEHIEAKLAEHDAALESHSSRLTDIEGKDGENWRKFMGGVIVAAAGAVGSMIIAVIKMLG